MESLEKTGFAKLDKDVRVSSFKIATRKMNDLEKLYEDQETADIVKSLMNEEIVENNKGQAIFFSKLAPKIKGVSVNQQVAGGGFDPIYNYYAAQTNIRFERKNIIFGNKYTLEGNNKVVSKELEINDIIAEKGVKAGSNPFASASVGFDEDLEVINNVDYNQYLSSDPTDYVGIMHRKLTYGNKRALVNKNFRLGFFVDRNLMEEMGYQRVDAQDYIDAAINNLGKELKIATWQNMIYDGLLQSSKLTTAGSKYNEYLDKIYVDHTNPIALDNQSDDQFISSVRNLATIINSIRDERGEDVEVEFIIDRATKNSLLQANLSRIVNATGYFVNFEGTRLQYLLSQCGANGKFSIIEILGLSNTEQTQGTYFNHTIASGKKLNGLMVKDLFQYSELLAPSTYMDTGLEPLTALHDFEKYTKTTPISGSALVLTNMTPIFTSGMSYESNYNLYASLFTINE